MAEIKGKGEMECERKKRPKRKQWLRWNEKGSEGEKRLEKNVERERKKETKRQRDETGKEKRYREKVR
jgi:hypothetical protein